MQVRGGCADALIDVVSSPQPQSNNALGLLSLLHPPLILLLSPPSHLSLLKKASYAETSSLFFS